MATIAAEHGWTMTRHASKSLLRHLVRTNERIGTPSVHGVVRKVLVASTGNDCQFVMKTVKIPRKYINFIIETPENNNNSINRNKYLDKIESFKTEISVGSLKYIANVGPRVYAWRITPTGGEYIMDNVQLGDCTAKVYPFGRLKKNEKILQLVLDAIDRFHKITKGYHGDLHKNNIQVVQLKSGKMYVMIIDYGNWRPMTVNMPKNATPPVYVRNKNSYLGISHSKNNNGINVFFPGNRGTPFIRNNNMIKRMLKN